jgi:hypothetical protein
MSAPIRICILAPVNTDHYNQMLLDAVEPVMPPDVTVEVRNITQGHDCIESRTDWLQNGYPVVLLAQAIEQEGFDGIWLSDFDMCGVEAARECINIPIIGGLHGPGPEPALFDHHHPREHAGHAAWPPADLWHRGQLCLHPRH